MDMLQESETVFNLSLVTTSNIVLWPCLPLLIFSGILDVPSLKVFLSPPLDIYNPNQFPLININNKLIWRGVFIITGYMLLYYRNDFSAIKYNFLATRVCKCGLLFGLVWDPGVSGYLESKDTMISDQILWRMRYIMFGLYDN